MYSDIPHSRCGIYRSGVRRTPMADDPRGFCQRFVLRSTNLRVVWPPPSELIRTAFEREGILSNREWNFKTAAGGLARQGLSRSFLRNRDCNNPCTRRSIDWDVDRLPRRDRANINLTAGPSAVPHTHFNLSGYGRGQIEPHHVGSRDRCPSRDLGLCAIGEPSSQTGALRPGLLVA